MERVHQQVVGELVRDRSVLLNKRRTEVAHFATSSSVVFLHCYESCWA